MVLALTSTLSLSMLGKHSTNYWAIPTPSVLFLKDVYLLVLAPPAEKSLKSCFSFDLYRSVLYTLIRRLQFFTELGKEDERGFVLGLGLITQSTCVIVLSALMLCLFQGTHRVFCKQGVQTWLCKKLLCSPLHKRWLWNLIFTHRDG